MRDFFFLVLYVTELVDAFLSSNLSVDRTVWLLLIAAGAFLAAGYNGMAFLGTKGADATVYVLKQPTKQIDAYAEFERLGGITQAGITSVVRPMEHFIGRCVKTSAAAVEIVVRLYLSIYPLSVDLPSF